jgi:hypothetical protein
MKNIISKNSSYIKKLLYKSFDSNLTPKEEAILKEELQKSGDLRELSGQITALRNKVKSSAYPEFSPYFESRLLANLNREQKQNGLLSGLYDSLELSFKKIALTAAAVLLILILYNVKQGNLSSLENVLGVYHTPIEYAFDPSAHLFENDI